MPAKQTDDNRREHRVVILFTETEYNNLAEAARDYETSISALIRMYVKRGGFNGLNT